VSVEVPGEWDKYADNELHNMLSAPNIIKSVMIKSRKMKWAGNRTRAGKTSNAYMVVVIEKKKKSSRRLRRRWEDNIKMGLKEIFLDGVSWLM
jgi:hypothetical protein